MDRRSGRPYYVVVDSGGWFTGNRYLLPINTVNFDRNHRQMRTTLDKGAIEEYPEFDRDAFESSDERRREYESRLMQTYGREPVRGQEGWWDYDRMEEFRKPEWWEYRPLDAERTRPRGPRPLRIDHEPGDGNAGHGRDLRPGPAGQRGPQHR